MTFTVEYTDCEVQFNNCHVALVESLGGAQHLAKQNLNNYFDVLAHNWKKKYNITLWSDEDYVQFKYLDFLSEKQYTMFILKWS